MEKKRPSKLHTLIFVHMSVNVNACSNTHNILLVGRKSNAFNNGLEIRTSRLFSAAAQSIARSVSNVTISSAQRIEATLNCKIKNSRVHFFYIFFFSTIRNRQLQRIVVAFAHCS